MADPLTKSLTGLSNIHQTELFYIMIFVPDLRVQIMKVATRTATFDFLLQSSFEDDKLPVRELQE